MKTTKQPDAPAFTESDLLDELAARFAADRPTLPEGAATVGRLARKLGVPDCVARAYIDSQVRAGLLVPVVGRASDGRVLDGRHWVAAWQSPGGLP